MAGNTANPRVWLGADVYYAPVGTTAPTDTTTAFSGTWVALGLLSEDGMTESNSATVNEYYSWGGTLVRTTRSKFQRQFKVAVLEDNLAVFALVNPGSTRASAGGVVTRTVKTPTANAQAFAFEMKDGAITKRIIVPRGEVSEIGDTTFSDSAIASKELTINAYPSAAGVIYLEYTDDAAA